MLQTNPPVNIAQLVTDKKRFISVLKGFLITEAFYSINEFFLPGGDDY
jgi:hypothetical protein